MDEELLRIIDLFDEDEVVPASKMERPQSAIDREMFEDFNKRNPLADGGRIGFDNGSPGQKINKPKGKSAVRKPFAPAIEKRIIQLANNNKLGAEAISKILTQEFRGNFSGSPVGKRITALKAEGIIKDIPVKEKAASIAMRGDLYGQPAGEKYLKIREIRDIDKKAIDRSTGRLKFKIPENAKFKINFGNTAANQPDVISNIPEKFRGVQYFTTKKAAEKALAERKKLKLVGDDPDPIRKKANKKKYDLVKEVSDNNIERILADFKKGKPLEQAHRLSLEQVKKTGRLYNVMNLGLDFDDPEFVQINNEAVKPFENKLKQLYAEQNKLYKQASNLKTIPEELRKQIEFNNRKISTVVDLADGRIQGLQLDEFTLKPKVYGTNYANVLGFGFYDKAVKELTDIDRAEIGLIMQGQVDNEKRTAGKTAQKLFANAQLLNDVDKLAVKSPPINQLEKNIFSKYAAIGCPGNAKGGRVEFNLGGSTQCIARGLEKVRSGTNLSPGDRANINAINNITKTAKGAKAAASAARILGAGVIAPEIVFGGFFAATDYATGADKDEIISNLTFGLGGKSMKEQLKESDPRYGQADKLTDVYQGYLSSLDKMGQPKQYVSRPGKRTTEQDVLQAMQPFTRVNPQLETGDFFDLGMYESQLEKDRAAEAKFAEDKIQRALERGFYDPGVGGSQRISEFQAAGGGIAKEAGDPSGAMLESMNPDSQGLSGLLKRAKKV